MHQVEIYYANKDSRFPNGYDERQHNFLGVYRIAMDGEEIFSEELPPILPAVGQCIRVRTGADFFSPWQGYVGLVTAHEGDEARVEFRPGLSRLYHPDQLEAIDVNS